MEVDEEEAKRLKAERKAAKKAAKLAAKEEQVAHEEPETAAPEADEEEALRLKAEKRAAKKAAKLAAAQAVSEQNVEEEAAPSKKNKRKAEEKDEDEASPEPKPEKKQKVETVEEAAKPADASSPDKSTAETPEELTVFVGGIPWSVTEEGFKKDFLECGEIERLNMLKNEEGKPKGIAFITFKTKAGVEAALKYDGDDYGGRTLKVNLAGQGGKGKDGKSKGKGKDGQDGKGKGKGNAENEIFVGGLAFECTEDALKEHISEFGEIASLRMPLNDEGQARGIAFICFKKAEEVEKALKLDGEEFMGRTLKVNKAGEGKGKGKGKDGKDGKGKDGKGKGKKGKGKKGGLSSEQKAAKDGAMVESTGVKQTFEDSDD